MKIYKFHIHPDKLGFLRSSSTQETKPPYRLWQLILGIAVHWQMAKRIDQTTQDTRVKTGGISTFCNASFKERVSSEPPRKGGNKRWSGFVASQRESPWFILCVCCFFCWFYPRFPHVETKVQQKTYSTFFWHKKWQPQRHKPNGWGSLFTVELLLRIGAAGPRKYFCAHHTAWTL